MAEAADPLDAQIDQYRTYADTVSQSIEKSGINVRAFVVLCFIRDSYSVDRALLAEKMGLDRVTTNQCVEQLIKLGLVRQTDWKAAGSERLESTSRGRALLRQSGN
jgi:DNA-binding MarR family transcriptional regulator